MVSARYEKEISVRMEYEEKQKKLEKMLKEHKKMVKESVKTEMRGKETERLEEIAETRKKAEFQAYLEAKHRGGKMAAAQ